MNSSRARYRAILSGTVCQFPGSVFDAPSAILAELAGYEVGILGGSVASLSVLGAPDLILLTLSELVEQCRRICRAVRMPLMVDADHGYGNALNVMRSVAELEAAGVAGLTIEDTDLPRRFGEAKLGVVSREEAVGKIRAALAARRDPALAVIGRTSAMESGGLEEALARLAAYEQAGADAVMATGVKTRAQIEAICAQARVPVLLGDVGPEIADAAYLGGLGVRVMIQGHHPYNAALQAVAETYAALRGGVKPADLPGLMPPSRAAQAERRDEYMAAIRQFLGG